MHHSIHLQRWERRNVKFFTFSTSDFEVSSDVEKFSRLVNDLTVCLEGQQVQVVSLMNSKSDVSGLPNLRLNLLRRTNLSKSSWAKVGKCGKGGDGSNLVRIVTMKGRTNPISFLWASVTTPFPLMWVLTKNISQSQQQDITFSGAGFASAVAGTHWALAGSSVMQDKVEGFWVADGEQGQKEEDFREHLVVDVFLTHGSSELFFRGDRSKCGALWFCSLSDLLLYNLAMPTLHSQQCYHMKSVR